MNIRNNQSILKEVVKEGEEKAVYFMSRFILTELKLSNSNDAVLDHNRSPQTLLLMEYSVALNVYSLFFFPLSALDAVT